MLLLVGHQGAIATQALIACAFALCPFGFQPDCAALVAAHAQDVIVAHAAPLGAVQNASSCSPFHHSGLPSYALTLAPAGALNA